MIRPNFRPRRPTYSASLPLSIATFVFACCFLFAFGSRAAEKPAAPRPNIVFILVDDLRWDDLACMGHPFVKTPHVDRLAREGAKFQNAFCTTPLCSPSRGNFLTGLYAHAEGIIDNTDRSPLSHKLDTFPRRLHDAGYDTAFIGKWHMGNDPTPRPGWDYWVCMEGQGECNNPVLFEDGKLARQEGYVTDLLNDRAVRFVRRQRKPGQPFLLYLAQKALHPNMKQFADGSVSEIGGGGFVPAERHKDWYADANIVRRPNAGDQAAGKPALLRKIGDLPPLSGETGTDDKTILDRLRMLAAVDEGVGQLLDALKETRQLDQTIFVFTSDHGYFYGEHGLSRERRLAYEETIRIPLLVRYPSLVKPGTVIGETTLSVDLAPTLLQLGGAEMPPRLHGRSLVDVLQGKKVEPRKSFLIEYYTDTVFARMYKMGYRAVRTDRWKYIQYQDLEGMDELYDLSADPYEMHNLIDAADQRETVQMLREELARLMRQTQ